MMTKEHLPDNLNRQEYGTIWRAGLTEFRKTFNIKGRQTQHERIKATGGLLCISACIILTIGLILGLVFSKTPVEVIAIPAEFTFYITPVCFLLLLIITMPAAFVRMRHDYGNSGTLVWLLAPIAFLGFPLMYAVIIACCFPKDKRDVDNAYGPANRNS